MVYCGRPSTGCRTCRVRKIKCDEQKPECGQCIRSQRSCQGYKNVFDVMLRDETRSTQERALKKANKIAARNSPDAYELIRRQPIASAITTSIEAQADCHFIANFLLLSEERSNGAFLDYLVPLLRQEQPDSPFRYAFSACTMAFFNNRCEVRNACAIQTRKFYAKALKSVNNTLRDPRSQTSNGNLAAVLLLGLFENITAEPTNKLAWGSHVQGAVELVYRRGTQQFTTKEGCQLFAAVRMQMVIHNFMTSNPPPLEVDWWLTRSVQSKATSNCQHLAMKVGMLRTEIMRLLHGMTHTLDTTKIMLETLQRCQAMDDEIMSWMATIPEYWKYQTISLDAPPNKSSPSSEVYAGRVDVYRDVYIAGAWNLARSARLILGSLVVRSIARIYTTADYRTSPEYLATSNRCRMVISDIIASVPYCLGWHLQNRWILREANLDNYDRGGTKKVKSSQGYILRWPLSCVNGQDFTTPDQRLWVIGRLRYIGDELGIKSAHSLADVRDLAPGQ